MGHEHLKHHEITGKILAAAFEVHKVMGNGFQEKFYQKALSMELAAQKLVFQEEYHIPVYYKGILLGNRYVDFFVERSVTIEIKAQIELLPAHFAQAINYLEAYNLEIGMLINFGAPSLQYHRFTNKKYNPKIPHPISKSDQ